LAQVLSAYLLPQQALAMGSTAIEAALRGALQQHLRLPPETLSYLASVLADLTPTERSNFQEVQVLLEPFLLDALKPGRQRPHDRKSDARVETLIKEVFQRLGTVDAAGPGRAGQASTRPVEGPARGPLAACKAAVARALPALGSDVRLPESVAEQLAAALMELPEAELADAGHLAVLLEPFLLDSFHDCGEWPASEDMEHLRLFGAALGRELGKLPRDSATALATADGRADAAVLGPVVQG